MGMILPDLTNPAAYALPGDFGGETPGWLSWPTLPTVTGNASDYTAPAGGSQPESVIGSTAKDVLGNMGGYIDSFFKGFSGVAGEALGAGLSRALGKNRDQRDRDVLDSVNPQRKDDYAPGNLFVGGKPNWPVIGGLAAILGVVVLGVVLVVKALRR